MVRQAFFLDGFSLGFIYLDCHDATQRHVPANSRGLVSPHQPNANRLRQKNMLAPLNNVWRITFATICVAAAAGSSSAQSISRDDIQRALDGYDKPASFDIRFEGKKSQFFSNAIMEDINTTTAAAQSSSKIAEYKRLSEIADLGHVYKSLAAVSSEALKFANLVIIGRPQIQERVLTYALDALELTIAVEQASASITSVPRNRKDVAFENLRAASQRLAEHYLQATIYVVRQEEMSYFSSAEREEAELSVDEVAEVDPNVKAARELASETIAAPNAYSAAFSASQLGHKFAGAIYSLQVAYEGRAYQALQETYGKTR